MTRTTDQERAEFESWWREEMNVEVIGLERTAYPMTPPEKQMYKCHETERAWLAWQASSRAPEAAPVQMPEPVAYVHVPATVWNGEVRPVVSFQKYEGDHAEGVYAARTPLYTEHQVRQLLAQHGIK